MIKDIVTTAKGGIRHAACMPDSWHDEIPCMSCRLQVTCGYLDNNNS